MKTGTNIAHIMAGNVVPAMLALKVHENVPKGVAGNTLKSNLLKNPPNKDGNRLQKLFENLDLSDIESQTEQQQKSVRDLLMGYQHLFAMNHSELGKTSLVQHDIKLDNPTLFKECYCRIPPHQY